VIPRKAEPTIVDLARWTAFDKSHPAPTFFSRPAWAMSFSNCYPNMIAEPHLFAVDHTQVFVPLVRVKSAHLPWRVYSGTPLGGYCVMLTDDGAIASPKLIAECLERLTHLGTDSLELNSWPFAPICDPNDVKQTPHETSVIDLANGVDAVVAKMSGNSRRMAGQAARRGVTCARETGSNAVDVYYDLLSESATRWGLSSPRLPKNFYAAVMEFGGNDAEIWIARYEGEAIAGLLALYGSLEVSIWSAAMRADVSTLRPQNILNVTLFRVAADRGLRWYNLGASEGLPGVKRFKDGLGAETLIYRSYRYSGITYSIYGKLRSFLDRGTRS
jgi:hypothetical protein